MNAKKHILLNGLSIGGAGGFTVGRELLRHLAVVRPDSRFSLMLVQNHPLHERMRVDTLPDNATLVWAPPTSARWMRRRSFERSELPRWTAANQVDAVIQLNGMFVSSLDVPTLAHNQDPWPYRPEAWNGPRERGIAWLKRRAHARALRSADCVSWTSTYLRDLICHASGIHPRRSVVLYNGLPDAWIARSNHFPDWHNRPLELVSVGEINPYKRQSLVIRALPLLLNRPGMEPLAYRIIGACSDAYRAELLDLARRLGVADRVFLEGRVSDERVAEVLGRGKCFPLMSVCESFGIPAIEAMSFGTPVVVSNCCALPEVCGDAAIISPVDDVEALANSIYSILSDPIRAEELRRRGAARVRRFTWMHTARQMADCLDNL